MDRTGFIRVASFLLSLIFYDKENSKLRRRIPDLTSTIKRRYNLGSSRNEISDHKFRMD